MKLVQILSAVVLSLFFVGCTPSTKNISSAEARNNIIGKWHSKATRIASDGVRIQAIDNMTFYRNGNSKSKIWLSFVDAQGKTLGKLLLTRSYKWRSLGNRVSIYSKGCRSRVLSGSKSPKYKFVSEYMKLTCKYANKIKGIKINTAELVNKSTLKFGNSTYTKL